MKIAHFTLRLNGAWGVNGAEGWTVLRGERCRGVNGAEGWTVPRGECCWGVNGAEGWTVLRGERCWGVNGAEGWTVRCRLQACRASRSARRRRVTTPSRPTSCCWTAATTLSRSTSCWSARRTPRARWAAARHKYPAQNHARTVAGVLLKPVSVVNATTDGAGLVWTYTKKNASMQT